MKIFISFLFFFILKVSFSQTLYLDKVSNVSKRTYTYQKTKNHKKLKLDFYKPKKIKGKLPLLLYVHGGGFSGGKRNDENTVNFSKNMAARGYAVASISYRLTMKNLGFGCNTKSNDKIKAFNAASKDISLAVQYLLKKQRKLSLDTRKIILVGTSAGAEAILNLVYVNKGKNLPKGFKFAGVISMAGAITSIDYITKETAVPTQLFHGTNDQLVPYHIAAHHYCKSDSEGYLVLYGSKAIANKLKKIEQSFYLYTINKGDHSWSGKPMQLCKTEILDFLYYDVLKKQKRQINLTI
ncbi:MAG: carboxylesterase family protein [Flavobacteriales bacterium]|jgi:acetyl esterase/lipase